MLMCQRILCERLAEFSCPGHNRSRIFWTLAKLGNGPRSCVRFAVLIDCAVIDAVWTNKRPTAPTAHFSTLFDLEIGGRAALDR